MRLPVKQLASLNLNRLTGRVFLLLLAILPARLPLCAQTVTDQSNDMASGAAASASLSPQGGLSQSAAVQENADDNPDTTIFNHPAGRFWLSGQMNIIEQGHSSFPAATARRTLRSTASRAA